MSKLTLEDCKRICLIWGCPGLERSLQELSAVEGWLKFCQRAASSIRQPYGYILRLMVPESTLTPSGIRSKKTWVRNAHHMNIRPMLDDDELSGDVGMPVVTNPSHFLSFDRAMKLADYISNFDTSLLDIFENRYDIDGKKSISIRRVKLADVYIWYHFLGWEMPLIDGDYVFVRNLLVWLGCIPLRFRERAWGLFMKYIWPFSTKEEFRSKAKKLSNYIKSIERPPTYLIYFIELSNAVGYQVTNYDFSAWESLLPFTKPLPYVKGLSLTRFQWIARFCTACEDHLMVPPYPLSDVFVEFKDYLKYGKWETTGASEGLKFSVFYNDEEVEIRGRRNHQKEFEDWPKMCNDILFAKDCTMRVIEKLEPGKVRLAFSTADILYMMTTYILQFCKRGLTRWSGYEYDLKPHQSFAVNFKDIDSQDYALLADCKEFDHQLELVEQCILLMLFCKISIRNIKYNYGEDSKERFVSLAYVKFFMFRLLYLMQRIRLKYKGLGYYFNKDGEDFKQMVEIDKYVMNCLLSGLSVTALDGGGCNKAWRGIVTDFLKSFTDVTVVERFKGDDIKEVCKSLVECIQRCVTMNGFSIRLAIDKTFVKLGGEFLRKNIYDRNLIGYLSRSISSFCEAKPWGGGSNSHLEDVSTMSATAETLYMRGSSSSIFDLQLIVLLKQLMHHGMDIRLLKIPVEFGGFGICPWDNRTVLDSKVVRPEPAVSVGEKNGWTRDVLAFELEKLGISVTSYDNATRRYLSKKVSSRDILYLGRDTKARERGLIQDRGFRVFNMPIQVRGLLRRNLFRVVDDILKIHVTSRWYINCLKLLQRKILYYGKYLNELNELHLLDYFDEDEIVDKDMSQEYTRDLTYLKSHGLSKRVSIQFLEGSLLSVRHIPPDYSKLISYILALGLELSLKSSARFSINEIVAYSGLGTQYLWYIILKKDLVRMVRF